jgi:methenyltetrahydromethanopterin cyclohydrolase
MLAQMAQCENFQVLAIDCYADCDTLDYSVDFKQINSLSQSDLIPAVEYFLENYHIDYAIYGSGFEYFSDSLYYLASCLPLVGNSPATFAKLQDKALFFESLKKHNIPFPITVFSAPTSIQNWLMKPMKGLGGVGISPLSPTSTPQTSVYFQQFQAGTSGSVLFLSDGKDIDIIGFNTQFTQNNFLFSSVINASSLTRLQRTVLSDWIYQLSRFFLLKGLHSLDFIVNENALFILEMNARPPASAQLYDANLITRHIESSFQHVRRMPFSPSLVSGYQIIYAKRDTCIPRHYLWPSYCADLPQQNAIIRQNSPICSIIAHKKTMHDVQRTFAIIQQHIERSLLMTQKASVNQLAHPLVKQLIDQADKLRVGVDVLENGCTIIDAGIKHFGGLEAGRIIAEICLGGMGTVTITHSTYTNNWPLSVNVHTGNPVLACLGSQYAGWSLSHEKYYALGSGPARAMATKQKDGQTLPVEELYQELAYHDESDCPVLVIENDAVPPLAIIEKIAAACGVEPSKLTIIVTPTSSLAGGVQVVARVLEVAMHKAHALHFPLENIVDGSGFAPICPPHPNFVKAMGRTNDAILFAGQVHIFVKGSDEEAKKLADALPSSTSKDYGKPFADIFKACDYDFFKIDAMLFSPASVIVTAVDSGKTFRAGHIDNALLDQSFGL